VCIQRRSDLRDSAELYWLVHDPYSLDATFRKDDLVRAINEAHTIEFKTCTQDPCCPALIHKDTNEPEGAA